MLTVLTGFCTDPRKYSMMEEEAAFLSPAPAQCGCRSVLLFKRRLAEDTLAKLEGTGARLELFDRSTNLRTYRGVVRLIHRYRPGVAHFHFSNQFSIPPILVRLAGVRLTPFTDHERQPSQLSRITAFECYVLGRVLLPRAMPRCGLSPSTLTTRMFTPTGCCGRGFGFYTTGQIFRGSLFPVNTSSRNGAANSAFLGGGLPTSVIFHGHGRGGKV